MRSKICACYTISESKKAEKKNNGYNSRTRHTLYLNMTIIVFVDAIST